MTIAPKTKAERKELIADLRDQVAEISDDLAGAMEEYREIRERIETLKEGRRWRLEAIAYLKSALSEKSGASETR